MNHWETTESVTNEAETIHFGENVCRTASPRPAFPALSAWAGAGA